MNNAIYILYFVRSNANPNIMTVTSKQEFASMESAICFAKAHAVKWVLRRTDSTEIARG